ncbi:hypothetical protein AB3N02_21855 [Priestia aryabhattai]|uniref:hypothetical protein n=1 Tax=Priestia aryabhattai TaxID=412384 RepID=UPI0039A32C28
MSDLQSLKKKILREDKVEQILEAIECEHIRFSGGRVEAQLPERFYSSNKRSVQVKLKPSLSSSIRNKTDFKNGDIFGLISYIHHNKRGEDIQKDLHEAKKFICELFGWNEFLKGGNYKSKVDHLAPLKAILKGKNKRKEIKPNPILPETALNDYYLFDRPLPYTPWIKEGISYDTQVLYGVGFDLETHRIVIPLRNRFGQLVGAKGRIEKDDESTKKYMYLLRCNNRYEWFNFHYAHPYILVDKRVYIFEAEKSCMKAFTYGIYNTVAIGASEISDEQIQIIKQIGLDIEIVLCYDKGIPKDEIEDTARRFTGRKVSIMYDGNDLLKDKDAPIDRGLNVWNKLVEENVSEIEV